MIRTDSNLREMITRAITPVILEKVGDIGFDAEEGRLMLAAIEARLLELFPTRDTWVPVEHKPGVWSLRHRDTGEQYCTPFRGEYSRLVTFISRDNALSKADELNRALMT